MGFVILAANQGFIDLYVRVETISQKLLADRKLFELPSLYTRDERALHNARLIRHPRRRKFAIPRHHGGSAPDGEFRAWLDAFSEGAEIFGRGGPESSAARCDACASLSCQR